MLSNAMSSCVIRSTIAKLGMTKSFQRFMARYSVGSKSTQKVEDLKWIKQERSDDIQKRKEMSIEAFSSAKKKRLGGYRRVDLG